MENRGIYQSIAQRTQGDVYIGVVGPVRTGKSTFIKKFMENLVIPKIENIYQQERAKDELPQSASGRTIMTAEPKFVPEEAVTITIDGGAALSVRLIDCVGYLVPGAVGATENDMPRMIATPWFEQEIPMAEAAEIGTRKVIAEHCTIGIVMTTDGTITDIPREDYVEAEERVVEELKSLEKPFVVVLNSAWPESERARALQSELAEKYGVTCICVNCLQMEEETITRIIRSVLCEFPLREMNLFLPAWVDALPFEHPIKQGIYEAIRAAASKLKCMRDVRGCVEKMGECESISRAEVTGMDMGTGQAQAELELPRSLFYETLSEQSGFRVRDDGDLLSLLSGLAEMKTGYDKVSQALEQVKETGYGIVLPDIKELELEEPEIVRQGGRYGVRLKASAPSIHMIRADVQTEVSPIMGTEKQSEEMIRYLLDEFEGDTTKIWQSNIFGKSFHDLVGEDLNAKLKRMPEDAQNKLRETLQRIINEGTGGLICIIL